MELCVNCHFNNKSEFEKAMNYLKSIGHNTDNYAPEDLGMAGNWHIIDHSFITQDQLNKLTALCPIKPKRKITKEGIYSKIAYGIGLHGSSYSPDDMLDDVTFEDCKILGLDPSEIAFELMAEFDVLPDHIKF